MANNAKLGRPRVDPLDRVIETLAGMTGQQREEFQRFITRWIHHLNIQDEQRELAARDAGRSQNRGGVCRTANRHSVERTGG